MVFLKTISAICQTMYDCFMLQLVLEMHEFIRLKFVQSIELNSLHQYRTLVRKRDMVGEEWMILTNISTTR